MKTCPKCGATKPVDGFYRNVRRKDGLCIYCKTCTDAYAKNRPNRPRRRTEKCRVADRERMRKRRESISLSYLSAQLKIPVAQITPELEAMKRHQLEVHRLTKQLNHALKEASK